MGPLAHHSFLRIGSSSLWIAGDLDGDPKLGLLADPDFLFSFPHCEIVKDQRKIKVGRVPWILGGRARRIYLKRYNAFSWRYRLGSLLSRSPAWRSWIGANILLQAGFRTGQPIAAVECRCAGMLTKSFYLSEEIPGSKTADLYWREELVPLGGAAGFHRRRGFLKALADLFRSLHQVNIYHNDLKDANILVSSDEKQGREALHLLDLEGIRTHRYLNRRRRIKNLVQLNRTLGRCLHGSQKLYWLKGYLGEFSGDQQERKRWIREILLESQRQDRRSLRKGQVCFTGPGSSF